MAAFSDGDTGGNPAGVALLDAFPSDETMQRIAAEIGYSEAAFAVREGTAWRVRYFAPATEIPFCGHATIALGAALARAHGDGTFPLVLNDARIAVEGRAGAGTLAATLQSPPTRSELAPATLVEEALALFGYTPADLDSRLPPALAHGGSDHLLLALRTREALAAMRYDFDAGRDLMLRAGIVTIALVHAEAPSRFHTRNAFAAGGVYEDPATGSAAAALAGYLCGRDWPHRGVIEIVQGEDMGQRSLLRATLPDVPGAPVAVSGQARLIQPAP